MEAIPGVIGHVYYKEDGNTEFSGSPVLPSLVLQFNGIQA